MAVISPSPLFGCRIVDLLMQLQMTWLGSAPFLNRLWREVVTCKSGTWTATNGTKKSGLLQSGNLHSSRITRPAVPSSLYTAKKQRVSNAPRGTQHHDMSVNFPKQLHEGGAGWRAVPEPCMQCSPSRSISSTLCVLNADTLVRGAWHIAACKIDLS